MKLLTSTLISVGLVAGCSKKDDGGTNTSTEKVTEAKPAPPSGPFAEFGSTDDILKKWQGAWVLETGSLGHNEAWEVKGNQITTFDGTKEATRELAIDSPCQGRVIESSKSGTSSTTIVFVFEGDKLHTGMGDAGIKKGDNVLGCGSGKIFVWDGKACQAHENNFGKWEHAATECKLDGATFTAKRPGIDMSSTFEVSGDLLMSSQMKGNKVEKLASFADAKAKLAALKK